MDWATYTKWMEEWGSLLGCLLSLGPTYNHANNIFHGWIGKKDASKLLVNFAYIFVFVCLPCSLTAN